MIRASRLAGPVVLLVITIGLFWKLTLSGGQFTWLNSPDISSQVLPWLNFEAREWHRHHFPLWDPYNWGGQSLVGRTEPGTVYPFNWLLFLMPFDDGRISMTALSWYYVLCHYLGALFCYLLCRDLGRSVAASVLGGTAFAAGGYLGSTGWPQMMNGAVWGPLVVLFWLRSLRGDRPLRHAALAGAFLGVSLLSGHHQIPTFVMLLAGGLWIYHLVAGGFPIRRFAAVALVFGCFAFLLGAAQVLPSVEYAKLAVRWVGAQNDPLGWNDKVPYNVHMNWALNPVSLLGLVLPGIHPFTNPYMGFALVSLALIGIGGLWGRKEVRLFSAIGIGGFLFALGGASVFHGIVYAVVPVAEKARNASTAIYIFGFAVAVLAAFGLDALSEAQDRAGRMAARLAAGLWIAAGIVYIALLAAYVVQHDRAFIDWRLANGAVGALLAGAVLLSLRRAAITLPTARFLLTAVAVYELGNIAGYDFLHRAQGWQYLDQLNSHADIAGYLKKQEGPFRVEVERSDVPYNFGEWYEIEECGGNSGVTANIFWLNGERHAHALLGERFLVAKKPAEPGQMQVFEGSSGVKVFRNPETFPRVWSVHSAGSISNVKEIEPEIKKPLEQLRRSTFVMGRAPELSDCDPSGDDVRLAERGKNRARIEAKMACRGMVILADTWFPGWEARVDGKQAPVYETYGFLRGVAVEAGAHVVELRYRPASVRWGAGLSGAGFAIVLALLVLPRRNRGLS